MTTTLEATSPGFIGRIPVRNIWLLLLYASQLYQELPGSRRVELEDAPDDIPELVAEILTSAVARRMRRNLNTDYQRRQHDLNRVRGRINLLRTERRQLLQRARVACIFDELTVDTPRNRYVKGALLRLASVIRADLASRCRNLAAQLERAGVQTEIDSNRLRHSLAMDYLGWTDTEERQMLAAAQLAIDLAIPTEESGFSLLPLVNRPETRGWELYERAVAGFYDAVLSPNGWRVTAQSPATWQLADSTPGLRELMPGMVRDVVLERAGRRIVIDTKFTSIIVTGQQGKETFKSGSIYQIYAYLRSQENDDDSLSLNSAGILLYPAICVDYHETAIIQGHQIHFATVNLAADSRNIRKQLLRILNDGLPHSLS
ncbi:MAG: 5-methylcytosine-specific restriction endonuclease system specificity protein McrC [Chloroflexi bacterium]|nr:5-methylcytosine-specific restriction endonuclease system specificity protein McrC [Chloroflexota bacterium]MYD48638.1 5-methylcytosine-specific restriction endonuclease system specificity protein McrC [Chloroflexota bacterium]